MNTALVRFPEVSALKIMALATAKAAQGIEEENEEAVYHMAASLGLDPVSSLTNVGPLILSLSESSPFRVS